MSPELITAFEEKIAKDKAAHDELWKKIYQEHPSIEGQVLFIDSQYIDQGFVMLNAHKEDQQSSMLRALATTIDNNISQQRSI